MPKEYLQAAGGGGGRDVEWSRPIAPMSAARELFGCAALSDPLLGERVLVCGGYTQVSERGDGAM